MRRPAGSHTLMRTAANMAAAVGWIVTGTKPASPCSVSSTAARVSASKASLPVQVALNKTVIDMLASADTTGFPIYTRPAVKVSAAPTVFWRCGGTPIPRQKFGATPAADLAAYRRVDKFVHTCDHPRRPGAVHRRQRIWQNPNSAVGTGCTPRGGGDLWQRLGRVAAYVSGGQAQRAIRTADIAPDVISTNGAMSKRATRKLTGRPCAKTLRRDHRPGAGVGRAGTERGAQTAMLEQQAIAHTRWVRSAS